MTTQPRPRDGTTTTRRPHERDPQRGGASVIALGIGLCVLVFAMVAVLLAAAIEARHRAQIGADAAALAGAMRATQGATSACGRAAELAAANDTTIRTCELSGMDITVEVTAKLPSPLRRFGPVVGLARAGPVG